MSVTDLNQYKDRVIDRKDKESDQRVSDFIKALESGDYCFTCKECECDLFYVGTDMVINCSECGQALKPR
mgnify:FL=1